MDPIISVNLSNVFGGGGLASSSDYAATDQVLTMQGLSLSLFFSRTKGEVFVPGPSRIWVNLAQLWLALVLEEKKIRHEGPSPCGVVGSCWKGRKGFSTVDGNCEWRRWWKCRINSNDDDCNTTSQHQSKRHINWIWAMNVVEDSEVDDDGRCTVNGGDCERPSVGTRLIFFYMGRRDLRWKIRFFGLGI